MNTASLTIGFLAREAGVNIETIRYYQRLGLIEKPAKPPHGYRRYPLSVVERIKFIKRAQKFGFSLAEVAELLALGEGHCNDVRKQAESKRDRIIQQIDDLTCIKRSLDQLIQSCGKGNKDHCPIIATFSKQADR